LKNGAGPQNTGRQHYNDKKLRLPGLIPPKEKRLRDENFMNHPTKQEKRQDRKAKDIGTISDPPNKPLAQDARNNVPRKKNRYGDEKPGQNTIPSLQYGLNMQIALFARSEQDANLQGPCVTRY